MQRDAIERLQLTSMLLEPELLDSIQPDVHLVSSLVSLSHVMPDSTKRTARVVVGPGRCRDRAPHCQTRRGPPLPARLVVLVGLVARGREILTGTPPFVAISIISSRATDRYSGAMMGYGRGANAMVKEGRGRD
jgi:hypothetical protein